MQVEDNTKQKPIFVFIETKLSFNLFSQTNNEKNIRKYIKKNITEEVVTWCVEHIDDCTNEKSTIEWIVDVLRHVKYNCYPENLLRRKSIGEDSCVPPTVMLLMRICNSCSMTNHGHGRTVITDVGNYLANNIKTYNYHINEASHKCGQGSPVDDGDFWYKLQKKLRLI